MTSLYQQLKESGCRLDSHESDLYVKKSAMSDAILAGYEGQKSTFISQIDGKTWHDLPFQYSPFWDKKQSTKGSKS